MARSAFSKISAFDTLRRDHADIETLADLGAQTLRETLGSEHAYIRPHRNSSGNIFYALTSGQGEILAVFDQAAEAQVIMETCCLTPIALH